MSIRKMLSQAELETEGSRLATIFGLPPTPHSFHGPLQECLRARRFRASLLLRLHPCSFLLYVLGALTVCIQTHFICYFDARDSPLGGIHIFKSPGKITTLWPLQTSQVHTYHTQPTPTSPTLNSSHRLHSPPP